MSFLSILSGVGKILPLPAKKGGVVICGIMFTQLPGGFTDAWKRVQPCPEQIIFPVLITTTAYKEGGVVICGIMFTQLPVGFTDARKRVQPCPEQIIFPVLVTTTT